MAPAARSEFSSSPLSHSRTFDIIKFVFFQPEFHDLKCNADCYFAAFERRAQALAWPPDVWSLLLQSKIHGKAQEVVAALPLDDSLDYNTVTSTILKAYKLVPEAYRHKFRSFKKSLKHTSSSPERRGIYLIDGVTCVKCLILFPCVNWFCWKRCSTTAVVVTSV